ncbi:MAG TPA: DUF6084 family protein [Lacipirellulaceae bacterium]|jgi:hypothetical protein|nr:DUF6084 family protein [Lacipirellulaceae bacterium]
MITEFNPSTVPDLDFAIAEAHTVTYAAVPQLAFTLRVTQKPGAYLAHIQSVMLRCQIRINPLKRRYDSRAEEQLHDLFGQPDRWSQTMRSLLWQHTIVNVPAFTDSVEVELPVPCTFDFNIAATKYFHSLSDGEIPLLLLFNGTIFYRGANDELQTAQIPWEKEASFRLPVEIWRTMMEHYYPNASWLCLQSDVFESLAAYKRRHSLTSWEQAISLLLEHEAAGAVP